MTLRQRRIGMRRRLLVGTIGVILAVLMALVPPVVILLRRVAERELQVRLSSQASSVSTAIADDLLQGNAPTIADIAPLIAPGDLLVITDDTGAQILRFGTESAASVTGSAAGPAGTRVTVSTGSSALNRRVRGPLLALGAFAILSVGLGALLATAVGRRLTRPLEQLAVSAHRLGAGDFSAATPPPSGIPEVDGIGAALGASAQRLDSMLAAERSFTGDATHQLRTGLTGIGLQLEVLAAHTDPAVRADADQARLQVERLANTLYELLALARGGAGGQRTEIDLRRLVGDHAADWRHQFDAAHRQLRTAAQPGLTAGERKQAPSTVHATPGLVGQIIDILIDNALRHGRGVVTLTLHDNGVSIADEGRLDDDALAELFRDAGEPARPHGRGLVLARRLAQADGGGVQLESSFPTRFSLRYPPAGQA